MSGIGSPFGSAPRSAPSLTRQAFVTSRLLDFFREGELASQIGHPRPRWLIALIKELFDNAVDICEAAGIAPAITLALSPDCLLVADNGPGISEEIIKSLLDFSSRVSTNSKYVSPTRGQFGNGLLTVVGAAYVVGEEHGHVEITAPSGVHTIEVDVDRLAQQPRLRLDRQRGSRIHLGTKIRVAWPELAWLFDDGENRDFYRAADALGLWRLLTTAVLVNPHVALTLALPGSTSTRAARDPTFRKWRPCDPTSPHWYSIDQFADLTAAYLVAERGSGRARSVRDYVAEFCGLSGTRKRQEVVANANLTGARLANLSDGEQIDRAAVSRLLVEMQAASRPVRPEQLGVLGADHLRAVLDTDIGIEDPTYRYRLATGYLEDAGTTVPILLEAAFAVRRNSSDIGDQGRILLAGINWSPVLDPGQTFPTLHRILGTANIHVDDPVVLVVHLAVPRVQYRDRGKAGLAIDVDEVLSEAVEHVTREFSKAKRQRARADAATLKRYTAYREQRTSLKEAVFEVLPAAIIATSGATERLPYSKRQLYYTVRKRIQDLTAEELTFGWFDGLLVQYREEHGPIERLYADPRGVLVEPHTGRELPIGTRDVARYDAPVWLYDKLLYVEKKGVRPLFEEARLAERYDVAIVYGEGYAAEAARDLLARLERDRSYRLYVLHDADLDGYGIARTLSEATRRMPGHHVDIVDLGLKLDAGLRLGLDTEEFTRKKAIPAATAATLSAVEHEYFTGRLTRGGSPNSPWYTALRIELNSFSAPGLIHYVEQQLAAHGADQKVSPPPDVLREHAKAEHRSAIRQQVIDGLARHYDLDAIIDSLVAGTRAQVLDGLANWTTQAYADDRAVDWRTVVTRRVNSGLHVPGLDTRVDAAIEHGRRPPRATSGGER